MSPRKRWLLFVGSMIFLIRSIWTLADKGFDWSMLFGAAFFGLCALTALFQPWLAARAERTAAERLCRITDQGFAFDRGYAFSFGALKGRKLLAFHEVQEIRLNTWPPTALVHGNELIFLTGLKKEDVANTAERYGMKTSEPIDIWELIGEEFLDTGFEEDQKRRTLQRLAEAGIPETEVLAIRKRLQRSMLLWTYQSMEWIYCGHYDVLQNRWPVRAKTYWWTMEVALRGTRN